MLTLKCDEENVYVSTGEGTTPMQLVTDSVMITKTTIRLIREQLGDKRADIYVRLLELILEEEKNPTHSSTTYRMDSKELSAQLNELRKIKHERDMEEDNGIE